MMYSGSKEDGGTHGHSANDGGRLYPGFETNSEINNLVREERDSGARRGLKVSLGRKRKNKIPSQHIQVINFAY